MSSIRSTHAPYRVESQRKAYLAYAEASLLACLNKRSVLERAAELLVPTIADHAELDFLLPSGGFEHFTISDARKRAEITRSLQPRTPDELEPACREVLADANARVEPSVMTVPLLSGDERLGVLTLKLTDPQRSYDDVDADVATEIARLIASAMERADRPGAGEATRDHALVQTLDAIVWEAEPEPFRFVFVSDFAEVVLGYPIRRWTDDPNFWQSIVHPEDRVWAIAHAEGARREAGTHEFEYRVVAADGRIVWLRERVQVEQAEDGRARTLRGLMIDITRRKIAQVYERAQAAADRVFARADADTNVPRELLRELCGALDWDVGAIWHVDERENVLRCTEIWHSQAVSVPRFEAMTRSITLAPGIGMPGRVWATGAPAWIENILHDPAPPRGDTALSEGLHGVLGFPLVADGRILGAVEFFSREIRPPDEEFLTLMATIGSQIGQYMLRRRAQDHALFQSAMLESQNDATIDGIVVTGSDGRLVTYNRRFAELWRLPPEPTPEDIERIVFAQHRDPEGARSLSTYLYQHPEEQNREEIELVDRRIFDRHSAPLRGPDGSIVGRAYYYRDITDAKRIEKILAENSERLAFLAEASEVLSGSLDYTVTLATLARISVPYLADWCVIDMVEPHGGTRRVALHHHDPNVLARAREIEGKRNSPPATTIERGVPRVIRTGRSDMQSVLPEEWLGVAAGGDEEYLMALKEMGFKSYMCVPLIARGETLGAITFMSAESDRHYNEADLAVAEDLARRAGLAVDNARLYSERAWVARTLQESLLPPHTPDIPGLEVGAVYLPAGRGLDVGGDFYDLFDTGRGEWAVLIGDVCGKGADAAALTALARYTLRAAVMQARAPRRVLAMLNQAILRQRGDDRFATVAYLRIYPEREGMRRVTLAIAGHPYPLVVRARGSIERAGKAGTLLGIFPEVKLGEETISLSPGDALVLYTDGVTEARGPNGEFGESGIREVLEAHARETAQHLATAIASAAESIQTSIRDDIAVVVLRVPPIPA